MVSSRCDSWIDHHDAATQHPEHEPLVDQLLFPHYKPAAKVYLDDRAIRFEGKFPSVDDPYLCVPGLERSG